MKAKRVSIGECARKKAETYHGSCIFKSTSPNIKNQNIKAVNIEISFDESLKLYLAIQSSILSVNKFKKNTKVGKSMGIVLCVKTDNNAISVFEKKI
ncbi:MAG: hypothetical protein WC637_13980 [Victivallales bacterium]|jgi:hypothetical protein